jgi:glycosyltransferase involved in cell wall biosynthesis
MKIIHVIYDAEKYGISTFLIDLVECQKKLFKDLEIGIAFHATGPCIDKFQKAGVKIYNLKHKTAKDFRALFKFYRIFKEYDIINLHTSSPWAFFAGKAAKKKIIFTFHGVLDYKNNWTDYLRRIYFKSILNKYSEMITFASTSSLKRYNRYINSEASSDNTAIFPYGIKTDRIKSKRDTREIRKELNLNGEFLVGTAARMDPMKRLDRLIDAFVTLPRNDYKLIIMGTGDLTYQNYLNRLVTDNKLQDQVHFLGYRKDVFDVINALDLFVLPSSNEPFGLALLEAMALRVPCAVFEDGGGTVDILGDSGFIVNSPEQLSHVIKTLKGNTHLIDSISGKVKLRARLFDIKNTADNFYQIYKSIFNKK